MSATPKQWSVCAFPWLASDPCLACDDSPCEHETWVTVATIKGPRRWPDPENAPWYVEDAEYAVRAVNAYDALVALLNRVEETWSDCPRSVQRLAENARTALKCAAEETA